MASTKATRVGEELVVVTPFFSMCIFQHGIGSGSKLMLQCAVMLFGDKIVYLQQSLMRLQKSS